MLNEKAINQVDLRLCSEVWCGMVLLLLLLVVAMQPLPNLMRIDRTLMLELNGSQGRWVDQYWYAFSQFRTWLLVMPIVAATLWSTCKGTVKQKVLFVLMVLLLLTFLDQLSSSVIKPLVARPRPSHDPSICYLLHYVNNYHGGHYGFVSGHATNIAGLATWLCLTFRDRVSRYCFIIFAFMLCYSRIYLGVHYPGDVIAGSVLGFTIAYSTFQMAKKYFVIEGSERPVLLLSSIVFTMVMLLVYSGYVAYLQ